MTQTFVGPKVLPVGSMIWLEAVGLGQLITGSFACNATRALVELADLDPRCSARL